VLTEEHQALKERIAHAKEVEHATGEYQLDRTPSPEVNTAVSRERLEVLNEELLAVPDGFTVHPKLARQLEHRAQMYESGLVDWALAEALAMGSLLADGIDVRVAGQDTRRGTFSQRHAVLVDYETGAEFLPLSTVSSLPDLGAEGGGTFMMYDTLLSEYAALGFEYGYSVETTRALVAWEAQFGDFVNGAQIVIDNFIAAAGEKWGQQSALVLLLPHGFEGQGPEHSSARLERFLQLSAGGNMTVAQPTTSAQYFHLLRAQVLRSTRRPLVVMTPKWLLRARQSRSEITELVEGHWMPVIDDPATAAGGELSPDEVTRIVLCTGKAAFDAIGRRDEVQGTVAVVRVEQLHPWPAVELAAVFGRYHSVTEVVWFQEEPENMGAWGYVLGRLPALVPAGATLAHVTRPEAGSPATGSGTVHQLELHDVLDRAVGPLPELEAED